MHHSPLCFILRYMRGGFGICMFCVFCMYVASLSCIVIREIQAIRSICTRLLGDYR